MGGDCAGNRDALALTAGKFVRKFRRISGMEADEFEQLVDADPDGALAKAGSALARAKRADRLGYDVADPPTRIERSERVLEDHLHAPAHRPPRGSIVGPGQIDAVDQHLPLTRLQQPDHHARQGRFPGAGFAHEAERFAPLDRKVEAVDSRQSPPRLAIDQPRDPWAGDVEHAAQAVHFDDCVGGLQFRISAAAPDRS